MRLALATLLCVMISGCVYPRMATFNAGEYAPYANPGTGSISGQAFLKTLGGEVRYGAGNEVYMNPVTSYSTEWFQETVMKNRTLKPADPRTEQFHWMVVADGMGNFKFENVADGDYYIVCPITWMVDAFTRTGDVVHATISVKNGAHVERVILRP